MDGSFSSYVRFMYRPGLTRCFVFCAALYDALIFVMKPRAPLSVASTFVTFVTIILYNITISTILGPWGVEITTVLLYVLLLIAIGSASNFSAGTQHPITSKCIVER